MAAQRPAQSTTYLFIISIFIDVINVNNLFVGAKLQNIEQIGRKKLHKVC
jgi:hypothetical protein